MSIENTGVALLADQDLQTSSDFSGSDGSCTEYSSTQIASSELNSSAELQEAWQMAIGDLLREVDHHIASAYLESLTLDTEKSSSLKMIIRGPSRLVCNYVTTHFKEKLTRLIQVHLAEPLVTATFLPKELEPSNSSTGVLQRPASHFIVKRVRQIPALNSDILANTITDFESAALSSNINSRYTFSDFVVGNSNQFCHAAAMRVAEKPGHSYNPLFIYGGVGLGKTHLLHAIGNSVLQRSPSARVLYMSSETFTNELIMALRHAKMDEFKRKLREIEVLLIDDIQFISGKERTQEEFFHTFNALYSAKRQIVMTSDKIPTDIPGIEERLQTRFSWGLTADLQAPDFETRVAILNQKALLDDFSLPEDVAHFIAEKVSSNVRELEGALTRLHAVSSIQSLEISLEMAKTTLKPLLQPKLVTVTVDEIKKVVAMHFSIKVSEIVSKRRTKNLSFPRHIAMYLCRKHTTASYPEIGEHFGGRDHSSVIHAASVVSAKLSTTPEVKERVETIEKLLLG